MRMRAETGQAGFTLIELLIVVVIIGILAAIALPKFANTQGAGDTSATMKSDLHNLSRRRKRIYATTATYYGGALPNPPCCPIVRRPGRTVTIVAVPRPAAGRPPPRTPTPRRTCAVFYGSGGPGRPGHGRRRADVHLIGVTPPARQRRPAAPVAPHRAAGQPRLRHLGGGPARRASPRSCSSGATSARRSGRWSGSGSAAPRSSCSSAPTSCTGS